MSKICEAEVLPSPEMELLNSAGLQHYLDPIWIPSAQLSVAIKTICNAKGLTDLSSEERNPDNSTVVRQIASPDHYKAVRAADSDSFRKLIGLLNEIALPIKGNDFEKLEQLSYWFMKLVNFFFLVRPSNKKYHYDMLTEDERHRFDLAFTKGGGKLFHTHCTSVIKLTLNEKKTVDPNDLHDMMQLILLGHENRLFVTDEKSFFLYQTTPELQRVLRWRDFRLSK